MSLTRRISIITVTFNNEATVEQTVQSVLSQSYSNIEYIIVDGKSSDNTLSIVEKHKNNIAKIISEKDEGLYDALNKGIAAASGDIIGVLHADDFYTHCDVIRKIMNLFYDSDTDAVYGNLYYVQKDNTAVVARRWVSGEYNKEKFLFGWMPPHPAFFIKRSHYLNYGLYNTSLGTAADYELMLRMLYKNNLKAKYLNETIVHMRTGGVSNASLGRRIKANMQDRKAWAVNHIRPRWYTLFLKPLRKVFQFIR